MKKYLQTGLIVAATFAPMFVFAQAAQPEVFAGIARTLGALIYTLVPVISSLALLAFFWGLGQYLFNFGEGDDKKQKQGRNLMLYGILVIFVMVSVFGIAQLLRRAFGISGDTNAPTPVLGPPTTQQPN